MHTRAATSTLLNPRQQNALCCACTSHPAVACGARTAVHQQHMAAEMLHVQAHKFPHKREALIDALIHLDDELTAHERAQSASQQGQPDLQKWLAEAPPSLRQTAAFRELSQHARMADT